MTSIRITLEETIRAALLQHADAARLPLSTGRVHAQAHVAARAAEAWAADRFAQPMGTFPPTPGQEQPRRPLPGPTDPPPANPTAPGQGCARADCGILEAVGWRWYVNTGWLPVCTRHMTGQPRAGRRHNREYPGASR